ncbi:MAG: S41 family peptidase [Nannocystaceae bacterium]
MTDEVRTRHGDFILHNAGDALTFTLCRVEYSASDQVVAIIGGANGEGLVEYAVLVLAVDSDGRIASFGIMPATPEDLHAPIEALDAEGVARVVDGVAEGLSGYVFADKAAAMATRIRAARAAGEYAGITNGHALAQRLSGDLFAVTQDKHLDVLYQAAPAPRREPTPEELERHREQAKRDNYGMPIAEVRAGNVGYLKVLGFHPAEEAADAISATMSRLADADVLVIDLRDNGGGSPSGVAFMSSYLFGEAPVHLNDLYNRRADHTESFYTTPDAPGRRYGPQKPVYVLTSARTFSAAEEFAYNLQARRRATIIGEVTGGGAHPIEPVRILDRWTVLLPTARAINPVTGTNWEGTGVQPDVVVPADEGLDRALELAAATARSPD